MSDIEKPQKSGTETANDLEEFMLSMMSFTDEDLRGMQEFQQMIAYKGFDPAELVEKMRHLQPDEGALAKDLSILIIEFLDTKRKSGNRKMSRQQKNEIGGLKRLTKLYGITKDSSDRVNVTLRRVAIAFAPMTVRILMKKKIDGNVTDKELRVIAGDSLPWCIRTQIYLCTLPASDNPAVAPHRAIFRTAIQATVCHSYLESKIICKEGRERAWTEKDYMDNAMKYAVISLKSEHLSEKDRLDVWAETLPTLSEGQGAMEKLIRSIELEVSEFASMFESSFGASIS